MRGGDDRAVEGGVGVDEGLDAGSGFGAGGQATQHGAQVGRGAAAGGQGGTLGLDGDAGLDDGDDVGPAQHGVPILDDVQRGDENACALTAFEDAAAREFTDGLAQGGAADAELGGQGGFAGEPVPEFPLSRADPGQQDLGGLGGERMPLYLRHVVFASLLV